MRNWLALSDQPQMPSSPYLYGVVIAFATTNPSRYRRLPRAEFPTRVRRGTCPSARRAWTRLQVKRKRRRRRRRRKQGDAGVDQGDHRQHAGDDAQ